MSAVTHIALDADAFVPRTLPPEVLGDRTALRSTLAGARKALSAEAHAALDAALCAHALSWPALRQAPAVGLYRSYGAEVDATAIAEAVTARGGQVCWARITEDEALGLEFVVAEGWHTTRNLPVPEGPTRALTAADVVVVPGLGFDLSGGRIGRGKGHYDRYLARNPVPALGLAYGCQVVQAVPVAAHDRPMSALATEHRLWVFAHTSEDEV